MKNKTFQLAKQLFCLVMAVMLVASIMVPAFADPNSGVAEEVTNPVASTTPADGEEKTHTDIEAQFGLDKEENQFGFEELDVVTTNDVNNWVDRKGNEVVSIIQRVARIVSVIGFFASLIFVAVGAFGNHKLMMGGLIGALVAATCYVAITYGKELLNLFSSWVMS